ncbi:MAG: hypothetical protein JNK20_02585 [Flavipsychrobacter sp.]|nr:hypothetical protein [Flavipsychrobacter sp.]
MQNQFITQSFDKFAEKTTTTSKPLKVKLGDVSTYKFQIGIRHVKSPDIDSLLFDVQLNTNEWLFIRSGRMIIKADIERFELQAHENYSNVLGYSGNVNLGMEESAFYDIDKSILEKICDASSVEIRIYGDSYVDFEGKKLVNFQLMCKQFYNNFYDNSKYSDALNAKVKTGNGCFIATAAMGDYNNPVVMDLRVFRDEWLLKRKWGIQFTNWYYIHGPKAAKLIEKSKILRIATFLLVVKPLQILTKYLK